MSSAKREIPVYERMLTMSVENDKNPLSIAYELHMCLMELISDAMRTKQKRELAKFCEAVMTKANEVQLYLGQVAAVAVVQMSSESIAQYTLFVQQLLTLYGAAMNAYIHLPVLKEI